MTLLTEALLSHPTFKEQLNLEQQDLFLTLAHIFQSSDRFLFLDPEDLTEETQRGNIHIWQQFLNLEPVQHFIAQRMTQLTKVAQRKSFHHLLQQAIQGSVQAQKELQELAGVYDKQDNSKQIILISIPRPTTQNQTEVSKDVG